MTIGLLAKVATQKRHMDIMEDRLFQLADQLKNMRLEYDEIIAQIIEENR